MSQENVEIVRRIYAEVSPNVLESEMLFHLDGSDRSLGAGGLVGCRPASHTHTSSRPSPIR